MYTKTRIAFALAFSLATGAGAAYAQDAAADAAQVKDTVTVISNNAALANDRINVQVIDGVTFLSGAVDTAYERFVAEDAASKVSHGGRVVSSLSVNN